MCWKNLEGQGNIEDRRSRPDRRAGKARGIGALGIVAILITLFLGGGENVGLVPILEGLQPPSAPAGSDVELTAEEFEYAAFAAAIVGNLDLVWTDVFDAVLEYQLGGSGGDFAEAYVIVHEAGHHVQNELNMSTQARQVQQEDQDSANGLSILPELEADCFAGVWAFTLADQGNILDHQDVQEAIDAASTMGDDRIQEKTSGRIIPEGWTHSSSEQRVEHFMIGFSTGDANQYDTFS